jgi:uncharacterized cofD-like protein
MQTGKNRVVGWLQWLLPGLGVKRWVFVAAIGLILLLNAVGRWLVAEGVSIHVNEMLDDIVDDYFSPAYLTLIFALVGIALIAVGSRQWLRALVRAAGRRGEGTVLETLRGMRLEQGYKIVAIGGGTGLSTLLRGLKRQTSNLTAVVTVSDDGGSSGRLQKELGVLPPGDIRNCLVALADDEALVTDLFKYRFSEGEGLSGHSFGNLFLAAMTGITGNFDTAVKESSRVLNTVGRVLPSTLDVVRLCAELYDGTIVEGESAIPLAQQPIRRVFFKPARVAPLDEVIEAIREADAIVLGPGSLYTSIAPNLLVDRIAEEIAASNAVKMYVCNVMTQPGETTGMTASGHLRALFEQSGKRVCDFAIVNDDPPQKLIDLYAQEGQVPVTVDADAMHALGVEVVEAPVISETNTVRHDPTKLANVVIETIDRAVAERATFVKPASAYRRGGVSRQPRDEAIGS